MSHQTLEDDVLSALAQAQKLLKKKEAEAVITLLEPLEEKSVSQGWKVGGIAKLLKEAYKIGVIEGLNRATEAKSSNEPNLAALYLAQVDNYARQYALYELKLTTEYSTIASYLATQTEE